MVDLTGAGGLESVAETAGSIGNADDVTDAGDIALNLAAVAIDGLGFLVNPLDAVGTWAIGWIVEHLEPLRWPLDVTVGQPEAIQNSVKQWNDTAIALGRLAEDYASAPVSTAPTYLGGGSPSAAALAGFTPYRAEQIAGASATCAQVARETARAAATIAATRALIRDTIVAFVWDVLKKAAARLAFAPVTFGATAAHLLYDSLVQAAATLRRIGAFLSNLHDRLVALVKNLRNVTEKLERYFAVVRPVGPRSALRPNPTGLPKLALDLSREHLKVDHTATATAEEENAEAVRAEHRQLDEHERTTEERNAHLPPPPAHETGDWWTRRGTLY